MAIEKEDLQGWAKEVIEEKAIVKRKEIAEKKANKKSGFWGSMFGGGGSKENEEKS
jgi:hypothetical protein